MGQIIQFAAPAPDPKPKLAKRTSGPAIRLTTFDQTTEAVRERLEFAVDSYAADNQTGMPPCECPSCETYRKILLSPTLRQALLDLFG